MVAGALSFTTILSIIPFLAVTLATVQFLDGFVSVYPKVEALVLQYFQGPAGQDGVLMVQKVFKRIHAGRMGTVGAIFLILASVLLVNDIERAVHRIWNLPKRRPLYQRIFFSWIFLVVIPVLFAVMTTVVSLKWISGATKAVPPLAFQALFLTGTLTAVYKWMPHTKVAARHALLGASIATAGLLLLTTWFKVISQTIFTYNKVYGSLAALPALLIWILLIWHIVLLGVAVTASFYQSENS